MPKIVSRLIGTNMLCIVNPLNAKQEFMVRIFKTRTKLKPETGMLPCCASNVVNSIYMYVSYWSKLPCELAWLILAVHRAVATALEL